MMKHIFKNEFTIALFAAILFIPFLGNVHLFDWDEINFAESAREMIASGNYFSVQINFTRFTEKPPLFFWMQVVSMKVFGVNEFSARFPNAICGIVTLVVLFRIGKQIFNEQFARIWVMVYLGTFVTFLYFKSGIIDPWFNLFIFLAIYHFYSLTTSVQVNRLKHLVLTGVFLGLAVLTKGPVAILIALLTYLVVVVLNRFRFFINGKEFVTIFATTLIVCFAWFGVDLIQNGPSFLIEFLQRQIAIFSTNDADHGEPFFYHWWVLLLGCFPASIFFMKGIFVQMERNEQKMFKQWMVVLFWVILLLFSIVKTKIVHYSSLCWFPLTAIASMYLYEIFTDKVRRMHIVFKMLIGIIGILLSLVLIAIPYALMNKAAWVHLLEDPFARANLQADVQWYWWDGFGGCILLLGVLFYLFSKQNKLKTILLFLSVTLCCLYTSVMIVPNIEGISQRANIEFFEKRQGEDCYVETVGYRSYAQYFYSKKQAYTSAQKIKIDTVLMGGSSQPDTLTTKQKELNFSQWVLYGNIDKPAYFSIKIQNKQILDTLPDLNKLYEKNGFAFYKRLPK
ncbi:MAG: glycosyltransferase family 39 protein [Chitinophagaceae bacterium]|nr:glycosyltransferase family 39 protein [Chitinophagaceae bacterium]